MHQTPRTATEIMAIVTARDMERATKKRKSPRTSLKKSLRMRATRRRLPPIQKTRTAKNPRILKAAIMRRREQILLILLMTREATRRVTTPRHLFLMPRAVLRRGLKVIKLSRQARVTPLIKYVEKKANFSHLLTVQAAPSKPAAGDNTQSGKQEGLSNTDTKHSTDIANDPSKSKKSEGGPDTAKVKGTVDPKRSQV